MSAQQNNPQPNMAPQMPQAPHNEGSVGPVIATVLILLVIILGGFYFWSQRAHKNVDDTSAAANVPAASTSNADIQQVNTQSSSDDLNAIQADLNATNVNSVDAGLQ